MKIKEALRQSTIKLQQGGIESAPLDTEILLSFVLKKPKEFLYTYPEQKLNFWQILRYYWLVKRRLQYWPVAYLTHQKEFYGYNFYVNKNVLIPRPLSEEIIEQVLIKIKKLISFYYSRLTEFKTRDKNDEFRITNHQSRIAICDLGTGSGNLIIALILELKKKYPLELFRFYAIDISTKALKVAKKNAQKHQVNQNITFLKGDLLKPLKNQKIDLILTNLPYLDITDVQKELSLQKEHRQSLIGDFYPQLIKQINQLQPRPILILENKTGVYPCQLFDNRLY